MSLLRAVLHISLPAILTLLEKESCPTLKPALLVVGDYNRKDYLMPFRKLKHHFSIYFLEFVSPKEVISKEYTNVGSAIFWKDYSDVFDIIARIQPQKVVFYYIESYLQTILNLACKIKGVRTYHLEHGLRDININVRHEKVFHQISLKQNRLLHTSVKLMQFLSRFRTRIFLLRSIQLLPKEEAADLKKFMVIRRDNNFINTLKHSPLHLSTANTFISYSPKIFEVHKYYHALNDSHHVHFIGIPLYDRLALLEKAEIQEDYVIFIDQGLPNRGLLGWTEANFTPFISRLCLICSKYNLKLFIKPHPSHTDLQKRYSKFFTSNIRVINDSDMEELIPQCRLIIGFFSTYLLPIIANAHTTVLTLENHPIGRINVSKSFIEAGVAHPVYDLEELHGILQNIEELHQKQLPHKAKFTEEWMYKFDGKAGERLRDILLSDEL